jgi:hypothetical protein
MTCSIECRRQHNNKKSARWHRKRAIGQIKTRTCTICGEEFHPVTLSIAVCSTACRRQRDQQEQYRYRRKYPERDRKRRQAWRDANRERERGRHRKYRAANREYINARERERRSVKSQLKREERERLAQQRRNERLARLASLTKTCVVCNEVFQAVRTNSTTCPACIADRKHCADARRSWKAANRERIKEEQRKRKREKAREWRKCEKARKLKRAWKAANPKRVKEEKLRYYKRHLRKQRLAHAALKILNLIPERLTLKNKQKIAYQTMKKHHPEFFNEGEIE